MNVNNDIFPFVRSLDIFKELNEDDFILLLKVMGVEFYQAGDYIIYEGDLDKDLLVVHKGRVEIIKENPSLPPYRINLIEAGDFFGEMALVENNPRSATVKALEPTVILRFDLVQLGEINDKLFKAIGLKLSRHLRKSDQQTVELLEEKIQEFTLRTQASNLLITLLISGAFYLIFEKIVFLVLGTRPISLGAFAFGLVLFQGFLALFLILRSGESLANYGVTLKNFRREAVEGLVWTAPLLIFFLFMKYLLIRFVSHFNEIPLFEFSSEGETFKNLYILYMVLYLLLIPLQEFVYRGCFQGCLRNFFIGPNKTAWSIIVSNILFGAVHSVHSLSFALGGFCIGIFWGCLYARQQSLVGVVVSHWLVVIWLFTVLNAIQFFQYL